MSASATACSSAPTATRHWTRYAPREARGIPPVGVGSDSIIESAIIDKNARIGRGVRIVNQAKVKEKDGDGYFIREGIVVVPKDGILPDGSVI